MYDFVSKTTLIFLEWRTIPQKGCFLNIKKRTHQKTSAVDLTGIGGREFSRDHTIETVDEQLHDMIQKRIRSGAVCRIEIRLWR